MSNVFRMGVVAAFIAAAFSASAAMAGTTPVSVASLTGYTNCNANGSPKNPNLKIAFAD